MSWKRNWLKTVLGTAVLMGGFGLLSVPAKADSWSNARNAEARHGSYSTGGSFYGGSTRFSFGFRSGDDNYFRGGHWFYRDQDNRFYRDDDRRWNRGHEFERDDRNFGRDFGRNGDRGRDFGRNRNRH